MIAPAVPDGRQRAEISDPGRQEIDEHRDQGERGHHETGEHDVPLRPWPTSFHDESLSGEAAARVRRSGEEMVPRLDTLSRVGRKRGHRGRVTTALHSRGYREKKGPGPARSRLSRRSRAARRSATKPAPFGAGPPPEDRPGRSEMMASRFRFSTSTGKAAVIGPPPPLRVDGEPPCLISTRCRTRRRCTPTAPPTSSTFPGPAPTSSWPTTWPPTTARTPTAAPAVCTDRKALVTGGDSGIGAAVAIAFAREGADVAIVYLPEEDEDAERIVGLIPDAGRKAVAIPGDLKDAEPSPGTRCRPPSTSSVVWTSW